MTEWNIVTVIVVIVGLIGTVAAPLMKNTKAMTQLGGEIKNLIYRIEQNEKETDELKVKASSRHKQIFDRLDEQGEKSTTTRAEYLLSNTNTRRKSNENQLESQIKKRLLVAWHYISRNCSRFCYS